MTRLLRRIAYWLRLSSHADELNDELAFHRDMLERELIAKGASPAEARNQARRTMGNETFQRDSSRWNVSLPMARRARLRASAGEAPFAMSSRSSMSRWNASSSFSSSACDERRSQYAMRRRRRVMRDPARGASR